MILNAIVENKKRFAKWALQYVSLPPQFFINGLIYYEHLIIEKLIENGAFTVQELKTEFKRHKIFYSNRIFKKYIGE